ncbi:gliding motility-associated C-terminal domain-containing protein [Dyadobacter sp. CY323]|uniref:gliding motility-associated C-terminal domain-containing protein n=1 Tax=Dyadobacter sp. CY323 TaxID=2907302 RepID=UPI001F3E5584|nr:gliding motility-associated C-terminal domain-containing protein [Dyadobacter sp. CY323]MCE6991722.1 gliding motility-associated C-terminal domain-containing protein [Dyadobacter sp. CY323]
MRFKVFLTIVFLPSFLIAAFGQTVKHTYRFYDDLAVAQPECGNPLSQAKALGVCEAGDIPGKFVQDMLPCGVQRTVYQNSLNYGLMYPNTEGAITETYTIQMYIKIADWGKTWARIIDFSNGGSDQGIYFKDKNGSTDRCIDFYPYGIAGACPFFNKSTYYLLTFTRNGQTGIMDVYVGNTLFASYNDADGRYVGKAGVPIYIFRDDSSVSCESGVANFAYLGFNNKYFNQAEVDSTSRDICYTASINSYAEFSISPNPSCGFPKDITITYTGIIPAPGTGYTFEWEWDGATVISGSGMGPYVVSWNSGGSKNVGLKVTNLKCGNSLFNRKQAVISSLDLTTSLISGTCDTGTDGTLTVTGSLGIPPYQYSIDSVNYQTENVFKISPATYRVFVKDGNNCTTAKTVNVQFNSDITVQTVADTTICTEESITLSTTSNAQSFSWQPQTGLSDANAQNPIAAPPTSMQYVVTASRGFCSQTDTVKVIVAPKVQVNVTPDAVIEYNVPFQLAVTSPQIQSGSDAFFLWSPSIGLNNPNSPTPIAVLQDNQSYTVEVTSELGCKGTGQVNLAIKRQESINIPTAFTPNGDGQNEVLVPLIHGIESITYFKIYNRWGELVFYTNQLNQGWDGYFKGGLPVMGTYVWEVEGTSVKGKVIHKKGSVMLFK